MLARLGLLAGLVMLIVMALGGVNILVAALVEVDPGFWDWMFY